ncbi:hypothetical protein [Bacillus sp. EAC]|uniref:hypothetical protein n=1 Tax=Bacillus sp. EAC TaxID=1978338 RepID=UPI000B44A3DB|nr:hypothetical protein [Bacillus sp. EAC]
MKRYRNMAVIAAVTTLSLGIFYTKVATSESKQPNFYLATEKGNSKEVKNIVLNAGYNKNGIDNNLRITTSGSEYRNSNLIFDQFNTNFFEIQKLNDLQKEEKNYMRGKTLSSGFYIDKNYIWYADARGKHAGYNEKNNGYKLYIDGMDRQNKDRFKFKLDIPKEEEYSYINVEDIQLIGKEIVVTTYQNKTNFSDNHNGNMNEVVDQNERVMYRINVSQKKIVETKVFNLSKNEGNIHTDVQTTGSSDPTQPNNYFVYMEMESKNTVQQNGDSTSELIRSDLHVINMKTGKDEPLNLSKEQLEIAKQSELMLDSNFLYIVNRNDKGQTVLKYSLERKMLDGEPIKINIPLQKKETMINNMILKGKLYMYPTSTGESVSSSNGMVIIIDLSDGKVIYEGRVKLKNTKEHNMELVKKLYFYDLRIQ